MDLGFEKTIVQTFEGQWRKFDYKLDIRLKKLLFIFYCDNVIWVMF